MMYDIAALQHLYGENSTGSSGNDIYNLSDLNDTVMTIWDSGGWDALDASASERDVVLDLNPGSFSTSGTAYGWYGISNNIAIAFGTIVEEARGGSGNDVLIGNSFDNVLSGGAGSDVFVLGVGWGHDIVTDFEIGQDLIDLSSLGIGFGDLSLSEIDGAAVVSYDNNDLVLEAVSIDQIAEADFLFGLA
jgi:hypothetical protein